MRSLLVLMLGYLGVAFAASGCADQPDANAARKPSPVVVAVPEKLTLYSIDGRDPDARYEPRDGETFQGYPSLGKVEVTDPAKRKEIMTSLMNGIALADPGDVPECWWPRHAIRAVAKGRVTDYVVCFECLQLEIHVAGSLTWKHVTPEPQKVLDKYLNAAKIPLAPAGGN